ncbi:hypothetical protein [Wielerella bovis]|uniref:hypothetical protein n=1 Tax=Wielerella bovis TaxID=2917790 RepID=UPI0020189210|nr:hypothetical protein [Wielerella bovis]ULJ59812.1 hypothetical protein MIS44_09030 [Wielerella bovis]ULJ62016.1 hypothetical protein MIS46_08480 [Wielerella bovis]ULJ64242.1 hypothetical protein MIS33_08795 [Wielerella bovis]ULJ67839.1 hypothetical protein MIS31_04660 [Wielerella bovis]
MWRIHHDLFGKCFWGNMISGSLKVAWVAKPNHHVSIKYNQMLDLQPNLHFSGCLGANDNLGASWFFRQTPLRCQIQGKNASQCRPLASIFDAEVGDFDEGSEADLRS